MNILQMKYFLVLASHENLSMAASELQLSPSALSKTIKRLEDDLGVKLFDRSNSGLRLNEAGILVRDTTRQVLQLVDTMNDALAELSGKEKLRINIIAISNLSAANVITDFKKTHSECSVNFQEASPEELLQADLYSKYDFMIASPDYATGASLECLKIAEYLPVLMVPKGHPLTKIKPLTLNEIARYPLITSPSNTSWDHFVNNIFREKGLSVNSIARATYGIRSQMVAAGIGISITAGNSIYYAPPGPAVEVLTIDDDLPTRKLYLYWNKNRKPSKAMRMFRDYVKESVPSAV